MGDTTRLRKVTIRLAKKNDLRCTYCSVEMTLPVAGSKVQTDRTATRDHVIPKSHGGRNWIRNYVVCCRGCNCERDEMPADLFALFKIWQRLGEPEL